MSSLLAALSLVGLLSACSEDPVGPTAEEVGQQFYEAVLLGRRSSPSWSVTARNWGSWKPFVSRIRW